VSRPGAGRRSPARYPSGHLGDGGREMTEVAHDGSGRSCWALRRALRDRPDPRIITSATPGNQSNNSLGTSRSRSRSRCSRSSASSSRSAGRRTRSAG
jgi:hypothetical protein